MLSSLSLAEECLKPSRSTVSTGKKQSGRLRRSRRLPGYCPGVDLFVDWTMGPQSYHVIAVFGSHVPCSSIFHERCWVQVDADKSSLIPDGMTPQLCPSSHVAQGNCMCSPALEDTWASRPVPSHWCLWCRPFPALCTWDRAQAKKNKTDNI